MKHTYTQLVSASIFVLFCAVSAAGQNLTLSTTQVDFPCAWNSPTNGSIDLTVTGGTPPYNYDWSSVAGPSNPQDLTGLTYTGPFCVTVTDALGKTATTCVTLNKPDCPVTIKELPPLVSTNGQAVTILPEVLGGTLPYVQYSWSNTQTGAQITVNPAFNNTYTVTVTDANGCSGVRSFPVEVVGSNPAIAFDFFNTGCGLSGDHSAIVYTYNLPPGNYTYTVTQVSNGSVSSTGVFSGNTFEIHNICTFGCSYTVTVSNASGPVVSRTFGNPQGGLGLYATSLLQITSQNPGLCAPAAVNTCEKVCPNTTVTYHVGPYSPLCDGTVLTNFSWEITGSVVSYFFNADKSEATITWGDSGAGKIKVGSQGQGCYEGNFCVEIVEMPEAKMAVTPALANPDSTLKVCRGQTVWFDNESENADLYEWQFSDDASNVTAENAVHTFNLPGTYSIALIARSLCYCADTTFITVEVLAESAPTLDCVGTVCPGESITYTTNSDCGSFVWGVSPNGTITNGGGPSDNSISIQWTDGPNGIINLEGLSCTGSTCPVASAIQVPVISDAAKIIGPTVVCKGTEVEYSIGPFDGTSYTWELYQPDYQNVILEGQGRSKIRVRWGVAYNGNFKVIVRYDNCYLNCSGADTLNVKVRPPMIITGPFQVCEGQTKSFATYASDWSVYAPDGSLVQTFSNIGSITPAFANGPGEYLLVAVPTLNSQNFTCSERADWKVKVVTTPSKPIGIDGPSYYCPDNVFTYTATGVSEQVLWTNSLTNQQDWGNPYNVLAPHTSNASFWVAARSLAADGSGCMSDTIRKNIMPLQDPKITGQITRCVGLTGIYLAMPESQSLNYVWEVIPSTAGFVVKGQGTSSVEIFWSQPGNHTVRLSVCGKLANEMIVVHPAPVVNPIYPAGICEGQTANLSASGSWSTYSWQTATKAPISNAPTVSVGPGTYLLYVTDANGCSDVAAFDIEEYPSPNLSVTTSSPTGFCANSLNVPLFALTDNDTGYDYEWYRDGNPLGVNQSVYTTNQYGLYTATVTNEYGCTASAPPILLWEYCGGGGGGVCNNPGHANPFCPPGSVQAVPDPSPRCDSFRLVLNDYTGQYVSGSALWWTGISGGVEIDTASGDNASFVYENAGKYLVLVRVLLQDGTVCEALDSVDVEALAQFTAIPDCPGDSTVFTDESTRLPDHSIVSWDWSFGDLSGGTFASTSSQEAKYPYADPGPYLATLTITTETGCTSSYSQVVEVPLAAQPGLATLPPGCANQATPFIALPSGDAIQIDWNFGQPSSLSNTAVGTTVYHDYGNNIGTYTVTATAQNAWGCTSSAVRQIPISTNTLSGEITPGGPITICHGQNTPLYAPPLGGSYLWSNGATTDTIHVATEGVYNVTVTAANGCQFSPDPRVVNEYPTPDGFIQAQIFNELGQNTGTVGSPLTICEGDEMVLLANTNASYQFEWSVAGEISQTLLFTEDRDNLLGLGSHTFEVTLTDVSSGCSFTTPPFTVVVNPTPADFFAVADNLCAGIPTLVSYFGPNQPDWHLSWNNGIIGPSFNTTAPGSYIVKATNTFGCSASSDPVVILPGPNIAALPAGCHERCNPDTICLPIMPEIVSWQWFYEGSPIPGATSSQFAATESGTYWAELVDTSGCQAQSASLTLELYNGFGNIAGQVWSDVNDNGIIDAADTLVAGIPVQLLQNGTLVAPNQSGANGAFDWLDVLSTNYSVQIDTQLLSPLWEIVIFSDSVGLTGCGGMVYTDLLVDAFSCATASSAITLTACPGQTANYLGNAILAGQSQVFSYQNATGCDSLVTVTVSALPVSSSTLNPSVCPGAVYTYNGVDMAVGQSQNFNLTNWLGCDSVVTVTVAALPTSSSMLNPRVCPGAVYTYNGVDLAVGQSQNFNLTNWLGCDSVVTVTVVALPVSSSTLNPSVCPGAVYTYNGVDLAVGQSQNFNLTNWLGCDSVVTVTVAALPVSSSTLNPSVCPGAVYTYNGVDLAVGQSQNFNLTNWLGCDSVLTVTVAALPVSSSTLNPSVCPEAVYTYNGVDLAVGQSQNFNLTNWLGCDSVVTVNVSALPTSNSTISFGVCPNETYTYQGVVLSANTTQDFVLTNAAGCDSVVTVTVFQKSSSVELFEEKVCPGEVYIFENQEIAIGETRTFQLFNSEGCDSTITISVTAWPGLEFELYPETSCSNSPTGSLSIAVVPGGSLPTGYSLDNSTYQSNPNFAPLAAGTQLVFVRDEHGCVFEKTVEIPATPALEIALPNVIVIPCDSTQITLQPSIGGDTTGLQLLWWNGAQSPSVTVTTAGPVWIEASNECGSLRREAAVAWADAAGDTVLVYVPNSFSPLAALTENTMFRPFFGATLSLLDYRMEVYDRWGNMVYETETLEQGWLGNFSTKQTGTDVFVWQMWARVSFCGREIELYKNGDVTVVR
jgi:PKD repeat protein